MPDIAAYLNNLSETEALLVSTDPPTMEVSVTAMVAFAHLVDHCLTREDMLAYRAWITYERMTGVSDEDLSSSLAVADMMAEMLGVHG